MKVLTMTPANAQLALSRKKWSTIRPLSYQSRFAEGEVVRLGKTTGRARITGVETIGLEAIDDRILLSEGGFRSKADLFRALKRFYPALAPESMVVLIRFVLV